LAAGLCLYQLGSLKRSPPQTPWLDLRGRGRNNREGEDSRGWEGVKGGEGSREGKKDRGRGMRREMEGEGKSHPHGLIKVDSCDSTMQQLQLNDTIRKC